jgi:NADH dehydrogenase (ubiquinone) 1 alpha subcomplex subunit 5
MLKALSKAFAARALRVQATQQLGACSALFGQTNIRGLKETTGIVGVEVDPEARANLLAASQQVLAVVAEKIPAEAQYRLNVEATFEHWIEQLNGSTDDEAVEEALSFQLEELTLMAKKELELIDRMAEWRPWEAPEGHKPEFISEQEVAERLEAAK